MANSQVERLRRLPRHANDTWQGGLLRMPTWVTGEGPEPYRPVLPIWISLKTTLAGMGRQMSRREEATFQAAVDALVDFATNETLAGYRPGKLEVNDPALAEHLAGLLAEADIRVEHRPKLLALERFMDGMAEHVNEGPLPPGILRGKGVTLERVRSFADAAKAFYEAAPWEHLSNQDVVEVEAPSPEAGLRYAVVLGQGGMEHGLGFYDSLDQYWAMAGGEPMEAWMGRGGLWSMTFDDVTYLPFADADLWQDHDLPVAGPRAYPVPVRFDRRKGIRRPSAKVLAFMEGLFWALAETTEEEMDAGRWTRQVETADGPLTYRLSLPFLLEAPDRKTLMDHGLMPDRRGMEQMSAQIGRFLEERADPDADIEEINALIGDEFAGKTPDPEKWPGRTPLEKAQDLCYQAFDAIGRRQIQLARRAMEVCPDCADAYVILAESAGNPEKALDLYEKGVEAGRRALGPETFEEDAGHFWGMHTTRPFMRALMGVAEVQKALGRTDEAADNYRELLRLNPHDNQGVRYLLLPLLIEQDADEEASDLLEQYDEESAAVWLYGRALLAFRREGDTPAARRLLEEAMDANPFVPEYLLDDEEPPGWPDGYSPGSEEEAIICNEECMGAWESTPGALDWLEKVAEAEEGC
jgi:tetratricopeptide (TPR) repeat protein